MYGVAQKDSAENIRRFLGALGDPYAKVGLDADGRAGIDWGVYGVPETFVVRGDGTIAYKFVGPMTAEVARRRRQAADPQGDGAAALLERDDRLAFGAPPTIRAPASRPFCPAVGAPIQEALQFHGVAGFTTRRLRPPKRAWNRRFNRTGTGN